MKMLSIRSDNSVPIIYVAYPTITTCEDCGRVRNFRSKQKCAASNVLLSS